VFGVGAAMEHVRALAVEIGIRMSGTEGDGLAADYIAKTMGKLGLRTERRPFPLPQGGESWNIVGLPPEFDEAKPYLLIGGHYDSLNGPGANDNATGIGVMLEIARAIEARPASYPVVFVAFGAEERQPTPQREHHVGSRHYVDQMTPAAKSNLVGMVNVDMVGHGDTITCGRMDTGPRDGTQRCLDQGRALGIPVKERVTPDWSDNGSFLRAGMNAAWVWTGELKCCYHNPRDTIDVVRPRELEWSGRLALAILRSFSR
jgi:Zn-dependent M28 family amino/carboxypeptidase